MHMDRTTAVMVGRMVVWMRVSQRRADSGALDGQRQHDGEGLSGHGDIVGEHGHRVKGIWTAFTRPLAPMATEPHAASFLATGLPKAGDVVGDERFLDKASPWSLSFVFIFPLAPLNP
jgi:hypothetical protein